MMIREDRERLFVVIAAGAVAAWWLMRHGRGAGGTKVGQDLAESFHHGFGRSFGRPSRPGRYGAPGLRFEVSPWRRNYYPAAPPPQQYYPTYQASEVPTYDYGAQEPMLPEPPSVTYRPAPPPSAHKDGVEILPPPKPARRAQAAASASQPSFYVMWTQRKLNAAFGKKLLDEDGILGDKTAAVLRLFQHQHGMPETGAIDKETETALSAAVA